MPDQSLALLFYATGLGLTRDPYMEWGTFNVWVNAGREQFHLPTAAPQVLRGRIGVVLPNLAALVRRLQRLLKPLRDTAFDFQVRKQWIDVTCPWGNQIRCHAPGNWGDMQLGLPYIEFQVPEATSEGIAAFYREVMGAAAISLRARAEVRIGQFQKLIFRESGKTEPVYDGHHIAVYVASFSAPHTYLKSRGLITEESDEHQYRFQHIIDPGNGNPLFEIEHEVRSLYHPMWQRNLVNRNPEQSFFNYTRDRDPFMPSARTD